MSRNAYVFVWGILPMVLTAILGGISPFWNGAPRSGSGEGLTPPLKPVLAHPPTTTIPCRLLGGSGGTASVLAGIAISGLNSGMSAAEMIEQFKALPPNERAEVAKFVVANDDSWVPDEFKEAMEDLEAGRLVDMEIVMSGAKPPPRPAK